MLKREVPTGPAADLLRRVLQAIDKQQVSPMEEIREFLAGAPAHTPLPLVMRGNAAAADLLRPNGSVFLCDMKPADAEMVLVAVNNFYALRDAALESFHYALDRHQDISDLRVLLLACGAELPERFQELPPAAPWKGVEPLPAPVMPAPPVPRAPLPRVGSYQPRPHTCHVPKYACWMTSAEISLVEQGKAYVDPI